MKLTLYEIIHWEEIHKYWEEVQKKKKEEENSN